MTKPKWYHYLLAAGSQDPDNPSPRMHNPYEEASAYANKDEDKLRKIHEDQIEYEKKAAPVKAATAVAAATLPIWGPYALHVGKVLLNPTAAKTALGGAVATTADLVGTGYGVKRNSELLNNWMSGKFEYSDPAEFALNLIPGYGASKVLGATGKVGTKVFKAATNAIEHSSKIATTPRYGKIKWYGPTMGKTTAAKTNPSLVDFDEISRHGLEQLAKKHGMTKQELMMSQDPKIRGEAKQLLKQMMDDWRHDPTSDGKTLVVSKSDVLDYDFDNTPIMLQREEFLRRNAARGETDVNNSNDWYNSIMKKGGDRILVWPDEKGVYISQIEPSTTSPYSRQVVPDRNMPTIAPYKSAYYGNFMEGEKFSPLEVTDYFKMGKDAAGKFFEHPVVKAAEEHNIALAKN